MTSDMQNPSSSDNGESAGGSTGAATRNSGLPMRGLAMILIAVAVLLAAWALWSMLGDSDESVTAETATTAVESTENTDSTDATGTAGATDTTGTADTTVASESPEAENTQTTEGAAPEESRDGERADQPAPAAGEPGDRAAAVGTRPAGTPVTTLHVLNNSTVPQLAARVAESLEPDFEKVESGNLPDVVIPRNTVYFTEGNPGAEQAARELADRVNGVAMERSPVLPEETGGKDALVLVLVEDVNL